MENDQNPTILTRLEPITKDYSIEKGIQARLKDPLYCLGKSWQLNEFRQRHNGGHAVRARIKYADKELDEIKLSGIEGSAGTFKPYDPKLPLEKVVEQEKSTAGGVVCEGWDTKRLEYRFSIGSSDKKVELIANENFGSSDWFSFDIVAADLSDLPLESVSVIPGLVSFSGMPLTRWWSIEDRNTDLGNIKRPDLNFLTMILIEFSLLFKGYDFYTLPLTHKVGTLRKIRQIDVVDSFGFTSEAKPVSNRVSAIPKTGINLFTMHDVNSANRFDGTLFYYPNTITKALESQPLEDVDFFRDDISNLVWAVENTVSKDGKILNRNDEERTGLEPPPTPYFYWDIQDKKMVDPASRLPEDAPGSRYFGPLALYQSMREMPLNWIPYQAGYPSTSGEYVLRRSRTRESGTQYMGKILEESVEINEEEIPKIGISVKRTYQVARDETGAIHEWLGRKKVTDDKRKFGGLAFDFLIER